MRRVPINVEKTKKGFQPTIRKPVSPDCAGQEEFFSMKPEKRPEPEPTYGHLTELVKELISERTSEQLSMFPDYENSESKLESSQKQKNKTKKYHREPKEGIQTAFFGKDYEYYEMSAANYLEKNYSKLYKVKIVQTGVHDSSQPDVQVTLPSGSHFFVEVKMPNAQSGQFALKETPEGFLFSRRNKTEENKATDIIINHLNDNKETNYQEIGSEGTPIPVDEKVLTEWITGYYKSKKAQFFMSGEGAGEGQSGFIIFPVDKFGEYFKVSAVIRKKVSGSKILPRKKEETVSNLVETLTGVKNTTGREEGAKHATISIPGYDGDLHEQIISDSEGNRYRLKSINGRTDLYDVRMLSSPKNTNPSVIFSVSLKEGAEQNPDDLQEFLKALQQKS